MPSASGDIFTLSADARYEGIVSGRAGAGGQVSVALEAEACHGLNLEASARVTAEANLGASLLLFAQASGSAFAAAGLNARIQLAPNVFERFGLIIDLAAHAEASAAARLSIGLDLNAIEVLLRDEVDGIVLDLALAFLREVTFEAGAWARVSAAAMAQAHVEVRGSLKEDEGAAFIVEAGAAAGLGAGAGVDFYCGMGFTDPRRFYTTAVDLITRELSTQARRVLPPELAFGAELVDLLLPIALHTAFDLGQKSALGTLEPPEQMVAPFLASCSRELQRYLIDKVVDAGHEILRDLAQELADYVASEGIPTEQQDALHAAVDEAVGFITSINAESIGIEDLMGLGGRLVDIAALARTDDVAPWRRTIAVLWTSMVCGEAIRKTAFDGTGKAGISIVGFGGGSVGGTLLDIIDLPDPPNIVLEAYSEVLGRPVSTVTVETAIDFLVESGVAPLLEEYVPATAQALDALQEMFGLTPGELIASAMRLGLGGDAATLSAYTKLREFAKQQIDGVLREEILPRLRASLGSQGDTYVADVAEPSIQALSTFVFERLDALVSGISTTDTDPFLNSLGSAMSTVVYRIFSKHVLYFGHVILDHVIVSTDTAFAGLAQRIESDDGHVIVRSLRTLIPITRPGTPQLSDADLEAIAEFAADMARAGRDAFGTTIWTNERRDKLHDLLQSLLIGFEGSPPYDDHRALDAFFRGLILCDYVPVPGILENASTLVTQVLRDQFDLILPRAVDALSNLFLKLTRSVVEDMDRRAREFLLAAAAALAAALRELNRWRRALADAIDAAEAAARDMADALDEVANEMRSSDVRTRVKDSLHALGAQRAEVFVRNLDGDPNNPNPAEDAAVAAAVGTFHLAFLAASPLIDLGLNVLADIAGNLAGILEDAANSADALEALITQVHDTALGAVIDGLADLGISLPKELSPEDVANAIADALPTSIILQWLDAAVAANDERLAALEDEAEARRQRDRAQTEADRREAAKLDASPAAQPSIEIVSPLTMATLSAEHWVYGPDVFARVRVGGARRAYFGSGGVRRVRVALNMQPVHYEPSEWTERRDGRFEWTRVLSLGRDSFVPGVNVFEVSVTDGDGTILRSTVAFVVDPHAPRLPAILEVVSELSQFNAPGNDHRAADEEFVTMRWNGDAPLLIDGWRLQDRFARHVFGFGRREIRAHDTLRLITGGSPPSDNENDVHWGRRAAVWNNTGDTVRVLDERRVLRAELIYDPAGEGK